MVGSLFLTSYRVSPAAVIPSSPDVPRLYGDLAWRRSLRVKRHHGDGRVALDVLQGGAQQSVGPIPTTLWLGCHSDVMGLKARKLRAATCRAPTSQMCYVDGKEQLFPSSDVTRGEAR
jgi:hypothetical protein